MAKIYACPSDIQPPDFGQCFTDGRYDREKDDLLHAEFIARLASRAQRLHSGDLVGKVVRFPYADGSAAYMVWNHRPFELIHLPIHDAWRLPEAHERGLRLSDIRAEVERSERLAALFAAKDSWWDEQPDGTILHYHNGFGEWVRGEVENGKLRPTALVGDKWNRGHGNYHARKIEEGNGAWRPDTGNVFEHPDFRRSDAGDPTTMAVIDHREFIEKAGVA